MGDTVFISQDKALSGKAGKELPKNHAAEDREIMDAVSKLSEAMEKSRVEGVSGVMMNRTLLEEIAGIIHKRVRETSESFPKLVEECPYNVRLAVVAWVFDALSMHGRDPGTFRHLIYERLGFEHDAYLPLQMAGAIDVVNGLRIAPPSKGEVQ